MLIRINKKISSSKPVKYAALSAALSAATSSGIWHDEDSASLSAEKRRNRIRLTRATPRAGVDYDA
ncbi:MAG: hypothetical protein SFW64_01675 [Alphaproteobacteria bacterium]|nr:hypothetical protein [Alphaproteobacteria bacterium]